MSVCSGHFGKSDQMEILTMFFIIIYGFDRRPSIMSSTLIGKSTVLPLKWLLNLHLLDGKQIAMNKINRGKKLAYQ